MLLGVEKHKNGSVVLVLWFSRGRKGAERSEQLCYVPVFTFSHLADDFLCDIIVASNTEGAKDNGSIFMLTSE